MLLAGAFNADGSQVISQTTGVWETQALLLSLIADGNDIITVGSGNDVIIGQGGNNTITAQGGNDIIFGNAASNTSPIASDIPWIVNAVVIAASNIPQISVPTGGEIVVPTVNLQPSALTPNAPQLEMAPPGFGALGGLAQGVNLALVGGGELTVFASVVPNLLDGSPALPGSNTINGGNGNDTIFGNFGYIGALPTTGITAIDAQLQGLSVTMLGLLTQFSALSTAQDALNVADATSTSPYHISLENNAITVGNGNDTIFANVGEYLVPGIAFAEGSGSLAANAVALDTYLLDMQEVFADMAYVAHEEGARVITSFGAIHNPAQATHLIDIGNDTINLNGSGSDLVVGDDGYVIMPEVGISATANWANGVSSATLQSVQTQLSQLESSFDSALKTQLAADHPFTASNNLTAQSLFGGDSDFLLEIGNDTINGGSGASTLIGDIGIILDPVVAPGSSGLASAAVLQSAMLTAIDRLFLGTLSVGAATAESWGISATSGDWSASGGYNFAGAKSNIEIGSDTINTGSGNDHIYGDLADIVPILGSSPGLVTSFDAYPSGEPGAPSTANFNYVYGFGPFGSLQAWTANATAPSRFEVDMDTITGGAGNNIMFGELGDDTIRGGAGNDQISGGWGFNAVSGGGGTNRIVFNRATDSYTASGGTDITVTALDYTAGGPVLEVNWSSATVGMALAAGMVSSPAVLIQKDGSTSLVEQNNEYYLYGGAGDGCLADDERRAGDGRVFERRNSGWGGAGGGRRV